MFSLSSAEKALINTLGSWFSGYSTMSSGKSPCLSKNHLWFSQTEVLVTKAFKPISSLIKIFALKPNPATSKTSNQIKNFFVFGISAFFDEKLEFTGFFSG